MQGGIYYVAAEPALIASGNDSRVYRVGDTVLKLYEKLPAAVLRKYLTALNGANCEIRAFRYDRGIKVGERNFSIAFDAVNVSACDLDNQPPRTLSRPIPPIQTSTF